MMKYPCLVKKSLCRTQAKLELAREGLTLEGSELEPIELEAFCNYQDSGKTVLTAEKKLIHLSGVALFPGDICPELPAITGGSIAVYGCERKIYEGIKARNPDGSVNYTEIRVM